MTGRRQPTVGGRGLGWELRSLRNKSGLSLREVAEQLGWQASKISRIETGKQGITPIDVASLLTVYGVTGQQRDRLVARAERLDEPGFIESQTGLSRESRMLMELETRARYIFNFEPLIIPGLLQTAEYTRAVMTAARGTEDTIEVRVASRLARQAILTRQNPPHVEFVIDEGALHRAILDPGLMVRQLRHITEAAERSNVTLRVIPLSVGAQTGLDGAFGIVDSTTHKSIAYIEHKFTGIFLEEPYEIDLYRTEADRLKEVALPPNESVELVTSTATDLKRHEGHTDEPV